jgi:thymidylate kinase
LPIISLDGINGTGKSTVANILKQRSDWIFVPEFVTTEIGAFLIGETNAKPHFITQCEVAQSLLFLSEYAERMDALHRDNLRDANIRVVERGWLSKYSYQVCVLERVLPPAQARQLVADILRVIPQPDAAILMRVSQDEMTHRLQTRDFAVTDDFLSFITRADELMLEAVAGGYPAQIIDTTQRTPTEIADIIIPYIASFKDDKN